MEEYYFVLQVGSQNGQYDILRYTKSELEEALLKHIQIPVYKNLITSHKNLQVKLQKTFDASSLLLKTYKAAPNVLADNNAYITALADLVLDLGAEIIKAKLGEGIVAVIKGGQAF